MLGKKLINAGPVSSGANTFASENFNTVLYTGNGGTQRIGGYINRGAVFNGSSSRILAPKISDISADISCSVFLKINTLTHTRRLRVVEINQNTSGYAGSLTILYRPSDGEWKIRVGNGSSSNVDVLTHTYQLTGETWYHLTVTRDDSTNVTKFYIDGSEQDSETVSASSSYPSDAQTFIGDIAYTASLNYNWQGVFDQMRIFNKALSSSEVTTLYGETHASTTIATTDIFNDNSGVALYQLDGNANDTGGVSGKFGSAAIFNGSSSIITLPSALSDGSTTTAQTISFWFNVDSQVTSSTSNNEIMNFAQSSSNFGKIALGSTTGNFTGETFSVTSDVSSQYSYIKDTIPAGWNHAVVQWETNKWQIYINGSSKTVYTWGTNEQGNWALKFGNRSTFYYDGKLDDIRIYSDQLTSGEITAIYNNTTASIPTDNLLAYYKLDGDARDEQQLYDGTATNVSYAYDGTATNVTYQEATKFSPDLIWIKQRTGSAANHLLFDSIRGAHKQLNSNTAFAETDRTSADKGVTSFDSNGFTVKDTSAGDYEINGPNGGTYSGDGTYAAWCFNAGDGSSASNTDGSITSTVKANQDAGFSIVKWTTTSAAAWNVGHGLDTAPEMIISKTSSFGNSWEVYHKDLGTGKFLQLHTTAAAGTDSGAFSSVTDTTWTSYTTNTLATYIAYCFHSVDGYSKVGSYTGNGSTSGPIVETGFEPAFIMMKATDLARNWVIVDNKRGYGNNLSANTSLAEYLTSNGQGMEVQFLSNGFQIETTSSWINNDTTNYIYLAIAADPDTTTPTVENSFDVVTYTGNNGTQKIATDFKPDLIWAKDRGGTYSHALYDSIRGRSKFVRSNSTEYERTVNEGQDIVSFDDDGFTLGSDHHTVVNANGRNYVAWVWKAGDHDDNLPQINTEGSIDSVVSVNAEAGFSIVKGTAISSGAFTVGHGLSQAPEFYVIKNTSGTGSWIVYTSATGAGQYLILNSTDAAASSTLFWNNTAPSSTVFQMNAGQVIAGGSDFIAYCFHSVTGYQKIGSYTGTGATGNSQTLGFRPRFIMIKSTSNDEPWFLLDSQRDTENPVNNRLMADSSAAEDGGGVHTVDFTDTGFTANGTIGNGTNGNGVTYIYLAIK